MSVPFAVLVVRYRVEVGERNDVPAVGAQALLVEAALPVLQLALVLVRDADVVVIFCAHASHSGVVAFQELVVYPLVMLHKGKHKNIRC